VTEKQKKAVQEWARKIGSHRAKARLIERRLSTSMVERIVKGAYDHELQGGNLTVLIEELATDGFQLADEAS